MSNYRQDDMYENGCMIEKILHIDSGLTYFEDTCRVPDEFGEAFEDMAGVESHAATNIDGLAENMADEYGDNDMAMQLLADKRVSGFLVKFAAQCPHYSSEDSCSRSWGIYTTEWFYFEKLDMRYVIDRLIGWAEDHDAHAREQFKKKK